MLFVMLLMSATIALTVVSWKLAVMTYFTSLERYHAYEEQSLIDSVIKIAELYLKNEPFPQKSKILSWKRFCDSSYDASLEILSVTKEIIRCKVVIVQEGVIKKTFERELRVT